jgi:HD-GYP domain-containing protein (c-di-GMP phosphodiesterase class II)
MRFSTRAFLATFVPFALLLGVSFWVVRSAVTSAVLDSLRGSVRDNQKALTREQARNEVRNRSMLRGVADNPSLKAGLQLLSAESSDQARATVQDQLSEICDTLNFDFMMVSGPEREPLAAVVREAGGFVPVSTIRIQPPAEGFFSADERLYEVTSIPVLEANSQVATLTVGGRFDISRFGAPAVLLHNGAVIAAGMRDLAPADVEAALKDCHDAGDCEVRIHDQSYLSSPLQLTAGDAGGGYSLRSLQNVDAAGAPVKAVLRQVFLVTSFTVLAAALGISALSSRSIARPLGLVVKQLRQSTATGDLPEFPETNSGALEIHDLMGGFNQAAKSVREGREHLTRAYVEFVGSLAQALDARDSYTAGHSRRVSEYSCAIAKAMGLPETEIETIRVGALLHDLGKIGISDVVLQKPGRLTAEETALIQQHPVIGRRILENVHGLEPYLGIVELHHENWDGTGYPRGLKRDETPLYARIVKVADAYDAMTSDRPYRRGMNYVEAIAVLKRACGTEMDAVVVEAFASLGDTGKQQVVLEGTQSLQNLSLAVGPVVVGSPAVGAGTTRLLTELERKEAM